MIHRGLPPAWKSQTRRPGRRRPARTRHGRNDHRRRAFAFVLQHRRTPRSVSLNFGFGLLQSPGLRSGWCCIASLPVGLLQGLRACLARHSQVSCVIILASPISVLLFPTVGVPYPQVSPTSSYCHRNEIAPRFMEARARPRNNARTPPCCHDIQGLRHPWCQKAAKPPTSWESRCPGITAPC